MQNTKPITGILFFYGITKSRDGDEMIVGVFEKQLSKKYARKFFKIAKKLTKWQSFEYDSVIEASDDVITS